MALESLFDIAPSTTADEVRAAIAAGSLVNARGGVEKTPLFHVVMWSSLFKEGVLEALLEAGADVNAKDGWSETPLFSASSEKVTKLLLAYGADPNVESDYGWTPLHRSHNAEQTRVLLEAGAYVNVKSRNSEKTPLHEAGSVEQSRLLLEAGADPTARDRDGKTPLDFAKTTAQADLLRSAMSDWKPVQVIAMVETPKLALTAADMCTHMLVIGRKPAPTFFQRLLRFFQGGNRPARS